MSLKNPSKHVLQHDVMSFNLYASPSLGLLSIVFNVFLNVKLTRVRPLELHPETCRLPVTNSHRLSAPSGCRFSHEIK